MKRDIKLLLGIAGIAMLAGCQNDTETIEPAEEQQEQTTLGIIPLAPSYIEAGEWGSSRADYDGKLPENYVPYNILYPTSTPENKTIGFFLTPERTTLNTFTYRGKDDYSGVNLWNSITTTVATGNQYYIYGFMPSHESASIAPLDGKSDYTEGAKISITNFNRITPADVCAIVGLRKAKASENITGPETPVNLGSFGYEAAEHGQNYLFLLLKHLYAGIDFKFSVATEYAKLRKIKVTKIELTAKDVTEKVNITLNVRANETNSDPLADEADVTVTADGSSANPSATIFEKEADKVDYIPVETETAASYLGCFAPQGTYNDFVLTTTYNVYDSKENLIRPGCTAENKLTGSIVTGLNALKAGELFTINLLVKPTYLYQLSDPDLDNPTITIE